MVDAALTSDAGLVGKKAARKVVEDGEVVRLRKVFQVGRARFVRVSRRQVDVLT